jgi:hypothetical protein
MLAGEKTGASYHLKSTIASDYLSGAHAARLVRH